jgi:hypothetical protein
MKNHQSGMYYDYVVHHESSLFWAVSTAIFVVDSIAQKGSESTIYSKQLNKIHQRWLGLMDKWTRWLYSKMPYLLPQLKAVKCTQSNGVEKERSKIFIFLSSHQSTQTPNPPQPPPPNGPCFCNIFSTFMCYVSLITFQLFKIAMFHY